MFISRKRGRVLVGLTALAVVGTTVSASAYAGERQDQAVATVSVDRPHTGFVAPAGRAAAPSWCTPGQNFYHRTQSCVVASGTLTVTRNRVVVGRLNFTVTQHIGLSTKSPKFNERLSVHYTSGAGDVNGFATTLTASCGGSCKASTHVPRTPTRVGATVNGTISYGDSTTKQNSTHTNYSLAFIKPGYLSTPTKWSSLTYRCDKGNKASRTGNYGTGCVFPGFAPTEVKQAALPHIAKNISRIQKAGPHHYGAYRLHGAPLHRTVSAAEMRDNRRIACGRRGTPPRGKSCDEYPFASTKEGAANKKGRPGDWGWAWVPVSEQNQQRDILRDFYRDNRILGGDRFWVAVP